MRTGGDLVRRGDVVGRGEARGVEVDTVGVGGSTNPVLGTSVPTEGRERECVVE